MWAAGPVTEFFCQETGRTALVQQPLKKKWPDNYPARILSGQVKRQYASGSRQLSAPILMDCIV